MIMQMLSTISFHEENKQKSYLNMNTVVSTRSMNYSPIIYLTLLWIVWLHVECTLNGCQWLL